MRSNVEVKRCGCGAILALREGCATCAARERARLHASGLGVSERDERPRIELRAREVARASLDEVPESVCREYFTAPSGKPAPSYTKPTLSQVADALNQARKLTGLVPYAVCTPEPDQPGIEWVDWKPFGLVGSFSSPRERSEQFSARWLQCDKISGTGGFVMLSALDAFSWRWTVASKGDVVFAEPEAMLRSVRGQTPYEPPPVETRGHKIDQMLVDEQREFQRTYAGTWVGVDPGYGDNTAVVTATRFDDGTIRIDDIKHIQSVPIRSGGG